MSASLAQKYGYQDKNTYLYITILDPDSATELAARTRSNRTYWTVFRPKPMLTTEPSCGWSAPLCRH